MKRIALLFLICLTLSGCARKTAPTAEPMEETVNVYVSRNYGSVTEENRDFFIGADITGDQNIDSISDFEEMTAPHDVYAEEVYIDEADRAAQFTLECLAEGKTPYIIIKDRDSVSDDMFSRYAEEMSEAIGRYNVEVMVEILENSYYYDEDGERYACLSELLSEGDGLVKKVWSVKRDDVIMAGKYMPEDADYICVNGYFSDSADADRLFSELRNHLNTDKRVIIRFGAACYSSSDCVYRLDEAVSAVEEVYARAQKDSGIAGIIYMDKNERLSDKVVYTDYSVTSDKKVTEGYGRIIGKAREYRDNKELIE